MASGRGVLRRSVCHSVETRFQVRLEASLWRHLAHSPIRQL
jgi:hypothetical protein